MIYCLNLKLSMCFKVRSKSPVKFRLKLCVTTVNNSFQLLPIFLSQRAPGLQLRCWKEFGWNSVTFTKILKGIVGYPPWLSATLRKYKQFTFLNALKIHFQRFFALDCFLYLISNGVDCRFVTSFCVVRWVKAHNHLIWSTAKYSI